MATYTSTTLPDGAEIDRRLAYVKYLEQLNSAPVGIKWDSSSSSPTLTRIDINGNTITPSTSFFDNHKLWGGMRRCTRNRTTGVITYGSDNAGTGLTLDGTAGDVLVEIPTAKYKFSKVGNIYYFWLIPYSTEDTKFTIHPSAVQRGGTARSKIYVGAYEAGLRDDAGTVKLKSVTGAQPLTGGEIKSLVFTSGSTAFTINETLTGATSGATGQVVDFHLSGGTWAGGDAAGTVYLKQCNATAFQAEAINGATAGANCATASGAASAVSLTMDQAEGYANALGTGFGVCNVWTYAYLQLLIYIETGTLDSQTALGKGIVDLASGTGYAGKVTGADSIDSRLGTNGTGAGSGTAGQTPICWRGIENPYGNTWKYVIGINAYHANGTDAEGRAYTAGSYRILTKSGTGTPAATLAYGSYDTGADVIPLLDDFGYISQIHADQTGALAFIPKTASGSNTTYLCDGYFKPVSSPSIIMKGGQWSIGAAGGPGCTYAYYTPSYSGRVASARLEYLQ